MPLLSQEISTERRVETDLYNRQHLFTLTRRRNWKRNRNDLIQALWVKTCKPGATGGTRSPYRTDPPAYCGRFLDGLLKAFEVGDDLNHRWRPHRFDDRGRLRISWDELCKLARCRRHQLAWVLRACEQRGVIRRDTLTIHKEETGRYFRELHLWLDGERLLALLTQVQTDRGVDPIETAPKATGYNDEDLTVSDLQVTGQEHRVEGRKRREEEARKQAQNLRKTEEILPGTDSNKFVTTIGTSTATGLPGDSVTSCSGAAPVSCSGNSVNGDRQEKEPAAPSSGATEFNPGPEEAERREAPDSSEPVPTRYCFPDRDMEAATRVLFGNLFPDQVITTKMFKQLRWLHYHPDPSLCFSYNNAARLVRMSIEGHLSEIGLEPKSFDSLTRGWFKIMRVLAKWDLDSHFVCNPVSFRELDMEKASEIVEDFRKTFAIYFSGLAQARNADVFSVLYEPVGIYSYKTPYVEIGRVMFFHDQGWDLTELLARFGSPLSEALRYDLFWVRCLEYRGYPVGAWMGDAWMREHAALLSQAVEIQTQNRLITKLHHLTEN
jgi:hypothetical protein